MTFFTDEEAKKERMPNRLFREMFSKEDEVDDDDDDDDDVDDELESERARRCECDDDCMARSARAAAAAAASCSLDRRRSARRRRVLSGLRRRWSRIMIDGFNDNLWMFLHGPPIWYFGQR